MNNKNNDYVFDITSEWITKDMDTTVTIDTSINEDLYTMDSVSTITLGPDIITLEDPTHWADNITWEQTEFVDIMPSLDKINNMCEHYPALEKAFENLKSIYKMVHQDYVGNHKKDDEVPF